MISVGIVDDEQLIRDGIRLVLQLTDDLEVVGEATNGAEARRTGCTASARRSLMDIRMPVVDGITATRRIVARATRARVLILTTYDRDELVFDAMRAGASGFLLKDAATGLLHRHPLGRRG